MERPASIVTFERCYLGAWIIGLINTFVNWNTVRAAAEASSASTQMSPELTANIMIGSVVVGGIITLLLWYFVARRGSAVAKWIVTVFFALGVVSFLWGLATGSTAMGLAAALGVVGLVLQAIAVYMLFRPDAKLWFGEAIDGPTA